MKETVRKDWHRELIYLGLATMEACWVYPWLRLLLGGGGTGPEGFLALWAVLLIALYSTRYLNLGRETVKAQRLVTVAVSVLCTLLLLRVLVYPNYALGEWTWLMQFVRDISNAFQSIPRSMIVFFAGLYLWWRGITLAQRELDLGEAGFSFRAGIIAFFWFFLVQVFTTPLHVTAYALTFFGAGLIVMGLTRVQEVTRSQEGIRSPFTASWMSILLAAVLGVSLLGLLAAELFSLRNLAAVVRWLNPLWRVLAWVASPLAVVLAWLLQLVLTALLAALGWVVGEQSVRSESLTQLAERLREWQQTQSASTRLPLALQILKWGFLALLFCAALAGIAFSIERARRASQEAQAGVAAFEWGRDSAPEPSGQAEESRWQRLWESLQARLTHLRGEQYGLATIRQVYASLVRLASVTGFPRQRAETPYEYVVTLRRAFPESADEILLITEAYVRAHYGEQRFQPEYVKRVREAWLAIRDRCEQTP